MGRGITVWPHQIRLLPQGAAPAPWLSMPVAHPNVWTINVSWRVPEVPLQSIVKVDRSDVLVENLYMHPHLLNKNFSILYLLLLHFMLCSLLCILGIMICMHVEFIVISGCYLLIYCLIGFLECHSQIGIQLILHQNSWLGSLLQGLTLSHASWWILFQDSWSNPSKLEQDSNLI